MSDLSAWPSPPRKIYSGSEPLSRRTQLRLENMETWSEQHLNSSNGCDPVLEVMEETIQSQGRLLVALLERWEENQQEENPPG